VPIVLKATCMLYWKHAKNGRHVWGPSTCPLQAHSYSLHFSPAVPARLVAQHDSSHVLDGRLYSRPISHAVGLACCLELLLHVQLDSTVEARARMVHRGTCGVHLGTWHTH
jgi:hypothetical protein